MTCQILKTGVKRSPMFAFWQHIYHGWLLVEDKYLHHSVISIVTTNHYVVFLTYKAMFGDMQMPIYMFFYRDVRLYESQNYWCREIIKKNPLMPKCPYSLAGFCLPFCVLSHPYKINSNSQILIFYSFPSFIKILIKDDQRLYQVWHV